jgi:hypothetical protein
MLVNKNVQNDYQQNAGIRVLTSKNVRHMRQGSTSRTLRTSEKPLEWTPDDGKPSSTSPSAIRAPSMTASRATAPTAKPATSYSPDA